MNFKNTFLFLKENVRSNYPDVVSAKHQSFCSSFKVENENYPRFITILAGYHPATQSEIPLTLPPWNLW